VALVPLFADKIADEMAALAQFAVGGAILVTPAGDIAIARGDVTPNGAHVARTNACRVTSDETAAFVCDDGSTVYLLAVTDGWVLGVQARHHQDLPDLARLLDEAGNERVKQAGERARRMGLKLLMRGVRDNLALWLAYTQLPHPGGRDSGQSGAPAEVFAERPWKRRN
jgi:hypothetical protein